MQRDKPSQIRWLKTISLCFARTSPGQWLWWAQLGFAGQFWPGLTQLLLMRMASARTTGMIWLPSPVSPSKSLPRARSHRNCRRAKASRNTQRLFPTSACAISADTSLAKASSKFCSDPSDRAVEATLLVRKATKSYDQRDHDREGWRIRIINITDLPQPCIFKGQQQ